MKRIFLSTGVVSAALVTILALTTAGGGAQQPAPPSGTLELVQSQRDVASVFVDNPPRRRESAGDIFTISGPVRDAASRRAGRANAVFVQTRRGFAQGSVTFTLGGGEIVVTGLLSQPERTTDTLAIVGGSGAYTGARGVLMITQGRRSTRFRFTFSA